MASLPEKILSNPHEFGHYLGYDKLEEINSVFIRDTWFSNERIEVLMSHRGSYKTTTILVLGIILHLMFNPNDTILIVRKELGGASSILTQIERHYKSDKMKLIYEKLGYKDFHIKKSNLEQIELSTKTKITKECNIEAIGVGGSSTGRHYDIIMADDIVTLKDRVSKAEREKTKIFVQELYNIINPGGKIVVTGTPWHKDDAFSVLPPATKYPIGTTGIKEFTGSYIDDVKKRMTPSLYSINYELEHTADDGKIFNNPTYEEWNKAYTTVGHIDAAYGGGNHTAFTLKAEGQLIFKGWVWQEDITDLYEKITELAKEHRCQMIYMEKNADKGFAKRDLEKYFPFVELYHENQNKHQKIVENGKYHWPEIRFAYDCQLEYLNQVLDYVEGDEPDDAPDSFASLIRQSKEDDYMIDSSNVSTGTLDEGFKV